MGLAFYFYGPRGSLLDGTPAAPGVTGGAVDRFSRQRWASMLAHANSPRLIAVHVVAEDEDLTPADEEHAVMFARLAVRQFTLPVKRLVFAPRELTLL